MRTYESGPEKSSGVDDFDLLTACAIDAGPVRDNRRVCIYVHGTQSRHATRIFTYTGSLTTGQIDREVKSDVRALAKLGREAIGPETRADIGEDDLNTIADFLERKYTNGKPKQQ